MQAYSPRQAVVSSSQELILTRKKWVSLVPAATVIPALLAYIKVVAVSSLWLSSLPARKECRHTFPDRQC